MPWQEVLAGMGEAEEQHSARSHFKLKLGCLFVWHYRGMWFAVVVVVVVLLLSVLSDREEIHRISHYQKRNKSTFVRAVQTRMTTKPRTESRKQDTRHRGERALICRQEHQEDIEPYRVCQDGSEFTQLPKCPVELITAAAAATALRARLLHMPCHFMGILLYSTPLDNATRTGPSRHRQGTLLSLCCCPLWLNVKTIARCSIIKALLA